jgi:thiol-disulfide isomerase/thioredoxin
VIYKPFDEKINTYLKEIGPVSQALPDSVQEFFATYGIEAGAPLTDNELNLMFENNRKMLFYARHSSNKDQVKYDSLMKELGLEFRSKKIYTSIMDIEGEVVYENVADIFGLASQELPALLYYDLKEDENNQTNAILYSIRNIKKEQLTKEYIKDYIKKVDDGKVKEDLFSEPPLESYNVSGLRYVIGRNYDKDVVENKDNVLIAFVERGNPVSERLADIMVELAKKYPVKEKKVVFAFMDITRNQPRDIDTKKEGVPFVLLFANTMKDKPIFKLTHKNIGKITIEEIEGFLYQSLKLGNQSEKKSDENKEKKKEDKRESDL